MRVSSKTPQLFSSTLTLCSDFAYDAVQCAWLDSSEDTQLKIEAGTRVVFEVVRLETKSDILAMTGRMLEDKAACILDVCTPRSLQES